MGSYDEELKRYCIMEAIRRQEEEEREMHEALNSLFSSEEAEKGESESVLPFLLLIGAVLWVLDKIDKGVRVFLRVPWVSQYVRPHLTWGNLFVVLLVWIFIRYMRSKDKWAY